jgi:hypothetical protein
VAGIDRGGAGVRGGAIDREALPGDRLDTGDDADVDAGAGQDGALLDVTLDVGVRDRQYLRGVPVESDPDQLILDRGAVGAGEAVGVLEGECRRSRY